MTDLKAAKEFSVPAGSKKELGREWKRTGIRSQELVDTIAWCLAQGLTERAAAAYVKVPHEVLMDWLTNDEEVQEAVEDATSAKVITYLDRIEKGLPSWQGCAWILERRWPARWARPETQTLVQINSGQNGTVNVVTMADWERLLASRPEAASRLQKLQALQQKALPSET